MINYSKCYYSKYLVLRNYDFKTVLYILEQETESSVVNTQRDDKKQPKKLRSILCFSGCQYMNVLYENDYLKTSLCALEQQEEQLFCRAPVKAHWRCSIKKAVLKNFAKYSQA